MALRLVTGPTTYPISLHAARKVLQLDDEFTDQDDEIQQAIIDATQTAEEFCERAFITQTWRLTLDEFPSGRLPILLPRPRFIETSFAISYEDTDGDTVALDSSDVQLDSDSEPGLVYPLVGEDWPSVYDMPNAVTVTYRAGYGDANSVPGPIKRAIKQLVAQWFKDREPYVTGTIVANLPNAVEALLRPYRISEGQSA